MLPGPDPDGHQRFAQDDQHEQLEALRPMGGAVDAPTPVPRREVDRQPLPQHCDGEQCGLRLPAHHDADHQQHGLHEQWQPGNGDLPAQSGVIPGGDRVDDEMNQPHEQIRTHQDDGPGQPLAGAVPCRRNRQGYDEDADECEAEPDRASPTSARSWFPSQTNVHQVHHSIPNRISRAAPPRHRARGR